MKMLVVIGILTLSACGLQKDPNAKAFTIPPSLQSCRVTRVEDGNRVFTCPSPASCEVKVTDTGVTLSSSC